MSHMSSRWLEKTIANDERSGFGADILIGLLRPDDFAEARLCFTDLRYFDTYCDWLDTREGLQLGLSSAGLGARIVVAELASFLAWCSAEAIDPSERALDCFVILLADAARNAEVSDDLVSH